MEIFRLREGAWVSMKTQGFKDIFVANGLYLDLTDQDYVNFIGSPDNVRSLIKKKEETIKSLLDSVPSVPIGNCLFIHNGDLFFDFGRFVIDLSRCKIDRKIVEMF